MEATASVRIRMCQQGAEEQEGTASPSRFSHENADHCKSLCETRTHVPLIKAGEPRQKNVSTLCKLKHHAN